MSGTYQTGLEGEAEAARHLEAQGFAILDQRFKSAGGEIDLVAYRDGLIVFVEVKKRATREAGDAVLEQIGARPERLLAASEAWMAANPDAIEDCDVRFDVVLIVPGEPVTHIENALV